MENVHYPRAPITEALLDIQVEIPKHVTLDTLRSLNETVANEYPSRSNLMVVEGQLVTGDHVGASARQVHVGYALSSVDTKQIFQAQLKGFTFNRLAPYERWETFSREAKRLWSAYRQAVSPTRIKRLAVRYINRLDLPAPVELGDYLRTYPQIAAELPQTLNEYFMRLEVPVDDLPGTMLINQTTSPSPAPGISSIILDIDLYRDDSETPQAEDAIWAFFEKLRDRKNRVFEACITERTRELIR